MENVKILDCTLRDGGRIIDCKFDDNEIATIAKRLAIAGIDIIELGFLRDGNKIKYQGNSTFFTDVDQLRPFIPATKTECVAFVDYGMYDFGTLKPYDGTSINGIRVGFTKKDKLLNYEDIKRCLKIVKDQGYKLYIQGVNSLNYSDKEILELIEMVNEVHPYSFGIVDTYGAMYVEDVSRIYSLIDNNLDEDIHMDFHSHNNYQLSFALAQEVIKLSKGVRKIIIDSTLNGMGKVAGNLNTELLVDYLSRRLKKNYDFDLILDIIDDYIYPLKEREHWGYSIPALFSGIYQAHPNNVLYLTSKFRLQTKDIKNILSRINPDKRQRYDYDNIDRIYFEYNLEKYNDESVLVKLNNLMKNRDILVLVPGESLNSQREVIKRYIEKKSPFIIGVNHVQKSADLTFWGNKKQYINAENKRIPEKNIITSNIGSSDHEYVVRYDRLINKKYEFYENSAMMLLNLLSLLDVNSIAIAGFDGFLGEKDDNYVDKSFQNERHRRDFVKLNSEIRKMLEEYITKEKREISFITTGMFSDLSENKKIKNEN